MLSGMLLGGEPEIAALRSQCAIHEISVVNVPHFAAPLASFRA
jgi:hypothetical protein